MKPDKGDLFLLRGSDGFDVCVKYIRETQDFHGAKMFLGEVLGRTGKVIVRKAFYADQILKKINSLEMSTKSAFLSEDFKVI